MRALTHLVRRNAAPTSRNGRFLLISLLGIFVRPGLFSRVPLVCRRWWSLSGCNICAGRFSRTVRRIAVRCNYLLLQGRGRQGLFRIIQIHPERGGLVRFVIGRRQLPRLLGMRGILRILEERAGGHSEGLLRLILDFWMLQTTCRLQIRAGFLDGPNI